MNLFAKTLNVESKDFVNGEEDTVNMNRLVILPDWCQNRVTFQFCHKIIEERIINVMITFKLGKLTNWVLGVI